MEWNEIREGTVMADSRKLTSNTRLSMPKDTILSTLETIYITSLTRQPTKI
jgi:hypothetical protein